MAATQLAVVVSSWTTTAPQALSGRTRDNTHKQPLTVPFSVKIILTSLPQSPIVRHGYGHAYPRDSQDIQSKLSSPTAE